MILLETNKLTKQFGALKAVNHVDITVNTGEIFGMLGPNGAGKTTMLKMFTTLLPPTSGNARIGGFDIVGQPNSVRHIIGYVPQMLSADGTLTGYENLLVFAKIYDVPAKDREKRIWSLLKLMNLNDQAKDLVRTYSGGMIRRLEIALSMLHHPKILFLDEPTVGMDPIARQTVWERIRNLREEFGLTIFLTTHYMDEAEAICDRVAIMNHGRIAAMDSPAKLKAMTGQPEATLEDAFRFFTGGEYEEEADYRGLKRTRKIARRLG